MPNTNFKNQTREDYWIQQNLPLYESIAEKHGTALFDDPEVKAQEEAERTVAREDELIWAFYKDPQSDCTQVQARDRAQEVEYPPKYQLSQSSISRKIKKLDKRMLTEPLYTLDMKHPDEYSEDQRVGFLARDTYEKYKRYRFIGLLDAWRSMLATFIVNTQAIKKFADPEVKTPKWAMERFPNLDPDVGRSFARRCGLDADLDLHSEQKKQVTNAD